MVSGPWGSGKTHFITTLMDELGPPGRDRKTQKPLYVSLNGVKEPGEIGDQLFQQLHPVLSHRATRLVGAVLRAAARFTVRVDPGQALQLSGALPDLDLSIVLRGAEGRVVIFDDFERAAMTPTALLGHINLLAEHDGCKVIVLSDESRIADQKEYRERKEKTIGRTFEFKADAETAFVSFMELIDDSDARAFFAASRETLLRVFADSGLDNLRLLKQFLWDFERLWKTLTPEQRGHSEAMRELVALLCVAAVELRSGRLKPEAFRRHDALHYLRLQADNPDEATKACQEMFDRYPTVRFDSTLLDVNTIVELVLKSKLQIVRIQQQLKQHPYFAKLDEMPSWRALRLSFEAPIGTEDDMVSRFESDFNSRVFRDEAEIHHIIELSLWLSELKFANWERTIVLEKVKRYITEVYDGAASPNDMRTSMSAYDLESSFGVGYTHLQDPRFRELACFQTQQRAAWQERAYPAIAAGLHKLMTEDSEAFLRDVCFNSGGGARFARRRVLEHIPADQFAAAIVNAQYRDDQMNVLRALAIRYQRVGAERELDLEVPWLKDVQRHLHRLVESLPRIGRFHLSRLVKEYVDKTVAEADARLSANNRSRRAGDNAEHGAS